MEVAITNSVSELVMPLYNSPINVHVAATFGVSLGEATIEILNPAAELSGIEIILLLNSCPL